MSKAQQKNKKVVEEDTSSESEIEVPTTKKQKTPVGAAAKAPAKAVNKKKVESSDEESEEDEIILPAKGKNAQKTAAKTDAKAKKVQAESSDDEEEPVAPPKKAAPAKTTKAPAKKVESSDEESEEEVKPAKKAAPATKAPAKKTPTVDDSVSDEESEEEVKPAKKAAPATTTKTTKAPAKKVESSDEESEEEVKPVKKAAPAKTTKAPAKKVESSDEEESEEEVKPVKKAAPATKAPAKKVQEEEEEEEDEEEEKPVKAPVKSAAQAAPATEEKKSGTLEVFVKNLPFACSAEDLKGLFAECGTIENVNLLTGPDGRSKGIAFIKFSDDAGVTAACAWNGTDFQGRALVVEKTVPKDQRPAKGAFGAGAAGGAREFPKTERDPNSASIFVGNLSFQTTEDSLRRFFEPCGKIAGLRIAMGEDGRPRGFAHVDFEATESVDKAMAKVGSQLDGRAIRIDYSAGRKNNAGGGFGGNRGGNFGGNGGFGGNRGFGGGRPGGQRMNLGEEDAAKKKGAISSFQGQKQKL